MTYQPKDEVLIDDADRRRHRLNCAAHDYARARLETRKAFEAFVQTADDSLEEAHARRRWQAEQARAETLLDAYERLVNEEGE